MSKRLKTSLQEPRTLPRVCWKWNPRGALRKRPGGAPQGALSALAEERLTAFRATGASELVTFSPRCAAHFKSVAPSVRVVDVSTVLARL